MSAPAHPPSSDSTHLDLICSRLGKKPSDLNSGFQHFLLSSHKVQDASEDPFFRALGFNRTPLNQTDFDTIKLGIQRSKNYGVFYSNYSEWHSRSTNKKEIENAFVLSRIHPYNDAEQESKEFCAFIAALLKEIRKTKLTEPLRVGVMCKDELESLEGRTLFDCFYIEMIPREESINTCSCCFISSIRYDCKMIICRGEYMNSDVEGFINS